MIADEYLDKSRLFARLKSGPHGQLVELYAACLVKSIFYSKPAAAARKSLIFRRRFWILA